MSFDSNIRSDAAKACDTGSTQEVSISSSSKHQPCPGKDARLKVPDFTVNDPQTGEDLTDQLCTDCRNFDLGALLRGADGVHQLAVRPWLSCPLCTFLGSSPLSDRPYSNASINESVDVLVFDLISGGPSFYTGTYRGEELRRIDTVEYRLGLPLSSNGHIRANPVPLLTDFVDLSKFRKFMAFCQKSHKIPCALPDRTIQQKRDQTAYVIRLIDCTSCKIVSGGPGLQYVALSYVWGDPAQQVINKDDDRFDNTLPRDEIRFPATIRDAITATIAMGFRYLWVDKYCIDQSNQEELQLQIHGMNYIYQNASLTIIAAAGKDANYGLPGIRSRPPQPRLVINGVDYVSVPRDLHRAVSASQWQKRAWTFQEGYFSRRRLIFTEEGVIFQCNTSCVTEPSNSISTVAPQYSSSQELVDEDSFGSELAMPSPKDLWKHLYHLERYSARQLTYQSDILNAIQGFVNSIADTSKSSFKHGQGIGKTSEPCYHLWGIPTSLEAYQYVWHISSRNLASSQLPGDRRLYAAISIGLLWSYFKSFERSGRRQGFPSWSWAGWIHKMPVVWKLPDHYIMADDIPEWLGLEMRNGESKQLTSSVLEATSKAQSRISHLYTYNLIIETVIIDMKLSFVRPTGGKCFVQPDRSHLPQKFEVHPQAKLRWYVNVGFEFPHDNGCIAFTCAVLYGHCGLLLRNQNGIYERIGIIGLDADRTRRSRRQHYNRKEPYVHEKALPHEARCLAKIFPSRKGRVKIG